LIEGPWLINERAIRDYLALRRRPATEATRRVAIRELVSIAIRTVDSGRAAKRLAMEAAAERAGKTLSDWLRDTAVKAARR
jgi:hypothetical protein